MLLYICRFVKQFQKEHIMKYSLEQITDAIFAKFLTRDTNLTDADGNSFTPGLAYVELKFLKAAKDKNEYLFSTRIGAHVRLNRKIKHQIYTLYENAKEHGLFTYQQRMSQDFSVGETI